MQIALTSPEAKNNQTQKELISASIERKVRTVLPQQKSNLHFPWKCTARPSRVFKHLAFPRHRHTRTHIVLWVTTKTSWKWKRRQFFYFWFTFELNFWIHYGLEHVRDKRIVLFWSLGWFWWFHAFLNFLKKFLSISSIRFSHPLHTENDKHINKTHSRDNLPLKNVFLTCFLSNWHFTEKQKARTFTRHCTEWWTGSGSRVSGDS